MKENKILYKIKSLDKMIARNFIDVFDCNMDISKMPTPTQMQILGYIIKNNNKDIYQKDLEKVLNLRRATVSGVLQTMEKNGLIKRIINEGDARSKKIILNENTKKIFNEKKKKINNIENKIVKDITEEDIKKFIEIIDKMKENLKD